MFKTVSHSWIAIGFGALLLGGPAIADRSDTPDDVLKALPKVVIIQTEIDDRGEESQAEAILAGDTDIVVDEATADKADKLAETAKKFSLQQSEEQLAPDEIKKTLSDDDFVADQSPTGGANRGHWHYYRRTPYGGVYGYGYSRHYGYGYRHWRSDNAVLYDPWMGANYGVYYRGRLYPYGYSGYYRTVGHYRRYYYYSPYRR